MSYYLNRESHKYKFVSTESGCYLVANYKLYILTSFTDMAGRILGRQAVTTSVEEKSSDSI
jgi:hypothetical protein